MGIFKSIRNAFSFKRAETPPAVNLTPAVMEQLPIDHDLDKTARDTKEIGIVAVSSPMNAYRTHYMSSIQGSRTGFDAYDYNMTEIVQAEDTESYLMAAFEEHVMTCLQAGWSLEGTNPKVVEHVEKRLYEIFAGTGISTQSLIRSIITNTVKFSNEYQVLVRQNPNKPRRTSGKPYKYKGQLLQPIVGIFAPDPVSFTVRRDKNGDPIQYKQSSNSNFSSQTNTMVVGGSSVKYFSPENVLHCAYKRKNGRAYGTPYVVPVLEDIRALRRIEEMTEILVSSHIFPLYHYIVGTKELPGSDPEIERIKEEIEKTPTEGSLVTTERHQIQVVGAEGKALEVTKYLEYFEKRVLAGLRISDISLGRGDTSNKNTAVSVDQVLIKRCADVNSFVADHLNSTLIVELTLDSGMNITYEDLPRIKFDTIDKEAERAQENHNLNLYTSNGLTETELRKRNNWEPAPQGADDTRHVNRVAIHQAQAEAALAPVPLTAKAGPGLKKSPAQKGAAVRSQPVNQHGKKATKTKTVQNTLDQVLVSEIDILINIFDTLRETDYAERVAGNTIANAFDNLYNLSKEYALEFSKTHGFDSVNIHNIIVDILKRRLHDSTVKAEYFLEKKSMLGFMACLEDLGDSLIGLGEELELKLQNKESK